MKEAQASPPEASPSKGKGKAKGTEPKAKPKEPAMEKPKGKDIRSFFKPNSGTAAPAAPKPPPGKPQLASGPAPTAYPPGARKRPASAIVAALPDEPKEDSTTHPAKRSQFFHSGSEAGTFSKHVDDGAAMHDQAGPGAITGAVASQGGAAARTAAKPGVTTPAAKKVPAKRRRAVLDDEDDSGNDFVIGVKDAASSGVEEDGREVELGSLGGNRQATRMAVVKRRRCARELTTDSPPAPAAQASPAQRRVPSALQAPPAAPRSTPGSASAPPSNLRVTHSASVPKALAAMPLCGKPSRAAAEAEAEARMMPGAKEAMAAVAAAVKALPPPVFSVVEEGANIQGNDSERPPHAGEKAAPVGHPDCLTGLTFVVTGVLDSLWRKDAEDLVRRHGGKVTSAVSGRTSFLLAGQNCGRSKHAKATEKSVKVIDEDNLFTMIEASQKFVRAPPPAAEGAKTAALTGQPAATLSAIGTPAPVVTAAVAGQLWVDRYKPTSPRELVGNQGTVETLSTWLDHWDSVHLHGQDPPSAKGGTQKSARMDLGKKAVLMSGPPGIGKTSAAHIIARERGYEVVEMNASDTRNKADSKITSGMGGKTANIIKEMVGNTTLLPAGRDGRRPRQLLIMDEVDGMSGGDRGGVQDLIQTIACSKVPIICICNDKYSQKLKSLKSHCLELEFRRPLVSQISKRMLEIATAEGLRMNQSAMDALVEGAHGDLRLILGQLQMLRLRTTALTYDDVKGRMATSKDFDTSPFECSRKILEASASLLTMNERLDLVLGDFDLTPLLIAENYVNHRPAIATSEPQRMRCLAKAADCISLGDVPTNNLRRTQNWSLMPAAGIVGSVMPAAYMRGSRESFNQGEMNFGRFTAWLGNNSTFGKQKRLLGDFTTTMLASGCILANRSAVRLDYASALRHVLPAPLKQADPDDSLQAVQETMQLMSEYCINREQVDFILDVTQFKTKAEWGADPLKDVPTKLKSAFTRTVNKEGLVAKCNIMVPEFKKGRGGKSKAGRQLAAGGGGGNGGSAAESSAMVDEDGAPVGDEAQLDAEDSEQQQQPGGPEEEEEEEEEGQDTQAVQRKLAKKGVAFQPNVGAGGKKGAASGSGAGRKSGSGRASGSRRGSGGSTRGGQGSGRGKP